MEALERRIERLRALVRQAVAGGERERARRLRAELREAERQWDDALARLEAEPVELADSAAGAESSGVASRRGAGERSRVQAGDGALLPAREQVHQALTLLGG